MVSAGKSEQRPRAGQSSLPVNHDERGVLKPGTAVNVKDRRARNKTRGSKHPIESTSVRIDVPRHLHVMCRRVSSRA